MGTIESYYKLLGIHSGATLDDIKRAFLEMEQGLQQDFQSEEPETRAQAQEKMREIFEAHEKIVKYFMEHGPPKFQEHVNKSEIIQEVPVTARASEPVFDPAGDTPETEEQAEEKTSPTISSSVEDFLANKTVTLILIMSLTLLVAVSVGLLIGIVAYKKSAKKIAPVQPARQAAVATTAYKPISSAEKEVTPQAREERVVEKKAPIAKKPGKKVTKSRKRAVPHQITQKSRENLENTINAAKQGDAEAQYRLGVLYDKGVVVKKDKREAVRWYRKAASRGHAKAQDSLEFFHE